MYILTARCSRVKLGIILSFEHPDGGLYFDSVIAICPGNLGWSPRLSILIGSGLLAGCTIATMIDGGIRISEKN